MKQNILSILSKSAVISAIILLAACQSDMTDSDIRKAGDPIVFGASVRETSEVRTRTQGLDSVYITNEFYDMDFYIQLCCGDHTELGTYAVASGYEGRLDAKTGYDPLNWHDLTTPHTFYAWNIPWLDTDKVSSLSSNGTIEPITVTFHNSAEADFDTYKNNSILENFIGAKSPSYSYKEHGKYVDLTFHHLVSKIRIGELILIETDGSIQKDLKADITFVGMPTAAKFYPHPNDNGRPRIEKSSWTQSEDDGLTYFIDNNPTTDDVFYICPEVNFNQIDFKVKLNSEHYTSKDVYYGTFDDVEFKRESGWAYDQGEDKDAKILHAGEMMTLNIVLIPGIGPGLSLIISDWSTEKPKEAPYHAYPGIYSDAEVREVLDAFCNQGASTNGTTQEDINRLFEMYGEEKDIDGDGEKEKTFPLYDNVDISKSNNGNICPIPKGYILDGMGHTITMKTNSGSRYVTNPYFNIGPARDIWLTDGTKERTIYIDIEGYVWIYDSNKDDFVQTNNQLPELTGDYKSYDISCVTGEIHTSTYYNNNITGS